MNGHIISGIPVCVDYWSRTPGKKCLHFLSHLHADHTFNLNSSFAEVIYTSPFNAWLVRRWFKIEPELVVSLAVGEPHVIFHESTKTYMSVTLIDANHCPGSVMFLFQGTFGNILYTGDFRYNAPMVEHPSMKSIIENEEVHRLYLDNTFAAEHCDFPPRHEVLQDVLDLIGKHPDHHILVGVRKLGKEELLRTIATRFKEQICVSKERMQILSYLHYPENLFTTDETKARIWAKQINHISRKFVQNLQKEKGPVLTILLTALYSIVPPDASCNPKLKNIKGVHYLPYSDHSCHRELVKFVSKVKPHTIYPIVNLKKGDISGIVDNEQDPNELFDLLRLHCTPWSVSVIPKSILKFTRYPKSMHESSMIGSKETLTNQTLDAIEITEDEAMDCYELPVSKFVATKSVLLEDDDAEECIPSTENNITYIPKPTKNNIHNADPTIEIGEAEPTLNCKESYHMCIASNISTSSENIQEIFVNNDLIEYNMNQDNIGIVNEADNILHIPCASKTRSEFNSPSLSEVNNTSILPNYPELKVHGRNIEIVNLEQTADQQIDVQDPNSYVENIDRILQIDNHDNNCLENNVSILTNESLPDHNTCPENISNILVDERSPSTYSSLEKPSIYNLIQKHNVTSESLVNHCSFNSQNVNQELEISKNCQHSLCLREGPFQADESIENSNPTMNEVCNKSISFYGNFNTIYNSWKKSVGPRRTNQRRPGLAGNREQLTSHNWESIFASIDY